jgi:hypothetical protein
MAHALFEVAGLIGDLTAFVQAKLAGAEKRPLKLGPHSALMAVPDRM